MDATTRVQEAWMATPAVHQRRCLAQRADGPQRAGSYFPGAVPEEVESLLMLAGWEEYSHPAVQSPAVAFKAMIPGIVDLVPLADLIDPSHEVMLLDPKGTGSVEACVRLSDSSGVPVEFTVALLGPGDDGEIVWTFFPGDPIRPSTIPAEGNVGRRATAAEAIAMGLTIAKVLPSS